MADLKQLFKTAVASSMDTRGKPALLGKIDGTLYWSSTRRDMVWARVGEASSFQEMVISCTKVTPQYDMPVRVDLVNGIMSVVAVDEKRYLEFSGNRPGGNVGAHAWLHGRLGPDPLYITGLQYLPLLVVPSNPANLTVTVKQGAYRWNSTYKIFEEGASGSLSAYVPGSAGIKHFVIICLDRVNNAIVIVDGDDLTAAAGDALFGTITLSVDDVLAISVDDTYLPLAAVLLYNGQTEVRAADIVMDLRTWGGEDFVGASGIPEPPDDAETYGRKTDGSSSWVAVVPKSGGAFSGAVSISSGGLTVNGGIRLGGSGVLYTNTSDGSDNASISVAGGGSASNTRGAHYTVFGNEFPTSFAGAMLFYAGDVSTGDIHFYTQGTQRMHIDYGGITTIDGGAVINGGVVFNEAGAAVNHRWESDGNANMLFINGGNNRVGVGGDPDLLFEVIADGGQAIAAVSSYENATSGSQFVARKARGSKGTPTAIQSNDAIGLYPFQGHDGSAFAAGAAIVVIANQTWTGSAHGTRMDFRTVSDASTSLAIRMRLYEGLQVGSPTGGDKGAGTINAQAIYDDNVLLTDHILDLYYDGRMSKADKKKYPNARLWSIEETAVFAKANRHLPTMPGREVWLSAGPRSVGELVTALWETVEQQQLQIFELNDRLKAVGNG